MCVAHIFSLTGFATFPTLLPALQPAWSLSNSQAGFVSGMFFGGYLLAVPLLTGLTDRMDARRIYLVSSLVAAVALLGMALFGRGFVSASLFQFLLGVGIAGNYMPGLRALADNTSGVAQSRATSFYTAIFGVGTSLSIVHAGWIGAELSPAAAFAIAGAGPLIAGLMIFWGLPARVPPARAAHNILDFRPVLAQREVRPYMFGYAVHCWELFGSRSWLVAFLVFAQARGGEGSWLLLSPVAVAAIANLIGPPASIAGNELALRFGRRRLVWTAMLVSGIASAVLGFCSSAPWVVVMLLAMLHMALVMGDSSAMTAAVVQGADPRIRGATLAFHSMLGFGAGLVSPLVFGAILDAAGGQSQPAAWGLAYASLGVLAVLYALYLAKPVRRTS